MLERFMTYFIFPIYCLWKVVLNYKSRKTVQIYMKRFKRFCFYLSLYFMAMIFYEASAKANALASNSYYIIMGSMAFHLTLGAVLIFISFSPGIFDSELKKEEVGFKKARNAIYFIDILALISWSTFMCFLDLTYIYPSIFIMLMLIARLIISVGFEFPDEPPKKKEEKKVNKNWLEDIIPPVPAGSN